jgi:hypothetical protein
MGKFSTSFTPDEGMGRVLGAPTSRMVVGELGRIFAESFPLLEVGMQLELWGHSIATYVSRFASPSQIRAVVGSLGC